MRVLGVVFTIFLLLSLGLSCRPAPPPAPFTFSGAEGLTTDVFEIKASEWQINWSYEAVNKKRPNFAIAVYPEGETAKFIEYVTGPRFSASGSTYLYKGKGKYYIKVIAKNVASWKVEVLPFPIEKPLSLPLTLSGAGFATTAPFKVKAKQFTINWTVEPSPMLGGKFGVASIRAYPRGELERDIGIIYLSPGSGTNVITGSGDLYLRIDCQSKWKIEITE